MQKLVFGINISRVLGSLVKSRIVAKIEKSRKRVIYVITDKLFEAWFKLREISELREDIIARSVLSTVSFESYVREILRFIPKPRRSNRYSWKKINIRSIYEN